jgi:hypothetical protein
MMKTWSKCLKYTMIVKRIWDNKLKQIILFIIEFV